jgi:hypothetical protein
MLDALTTKIVVPVTLAGNQYAGYIKQEFSHHTKGPCDQGVVNLRRRRSYNYVKHSDYYVKDPILNMELELTYTPMCDEFVINTRKRPLRQSYS